MFALSHPPAPYSYTSILPGHLFSFYTEFSSTGTRMLSHTVSALFTLLCPPPLFCSYVFSHAHFRFLVSSSLLSVRSTCACLLWYSVAHILCCTSKFHALRHHTKACAVRPWPCDESHKPCTASQMLPFKLHMIPTFQACRRHRSIIFHLGDHSFHSDFLFLS